MKRVMCVWLPAWSMQRQRRRRERDAAGTPSISSPADDPFEDLLGLYRLAAWCERFSPVVGIEDAEAPESLLIEIGGCEGIFGGEERLAQRAADELWKLGFDARIGVGDAVGAAWAAARFLVPTPTADASSIRRSLLSGPKPKPIPPGDRPGAPTEPAHIPPGRARTALASLPLHALRLCPNDVVLLHELGVRTVEQLDAVPRKQLAARFGEFMVLRLAQCWGEAPEVIQPHRGAETLQEEWHFEFPTDRYEIIENALKILAERLAASLRGVRGVQRLSCLLRPEHGDPIVCTAEMCRPCADPARMVELLRLKLEATSLPRKRILRKPPAPAIQQRDKSNPVTRNVKASSPVAPGPVRRLVVDGLPPIALIRLRALSTDRLLHVQQELFDDRTGRNDPSHAVELVERLANRIGRGQVLRPRLVPDPLPERSFRCEPVAPHSAVGVPAPSRPRRTSGRRRRPVDKPLEIAGADRSVDPEDPRHGVWNAAAEDVLLQERRRTLLSRPLRLIDPPIPVRVLAVAPQGNPVRIAWRNVEQTVRRCWGPERIETGWWRGADRRRDYYRVETGAGTRYWLFRELDFGQWFLHGAFD